MIKVGLKKLNTIILCPQLGYLFLIDKDNLLSFLKYKGTTLIECSYKLLNNALELCDEIEVTESETTELIKLQKELNRKTECYLSLHFVLNIFNGNLSEPVRLDSLAICDELLATNEIYYFVQNRLLSKPLINNVDYTFIRSQLSQGRISNKARKIILTIIKLQNVLKTINKIWETLSLGYEKFNQSNLFYEKMINDNIFSRIVDLLLKNNIDDVSSLKSFYKDEEPEIYKHFELFLMEIIRRENELYEALKKSDLEPMTMMEIKQKYNVLVIENDYATSKLLCNYLNKWGYQPHIVNSGDQALKAVEGESFLAILMDIVLPDMNGLELLKTLRENKNTKNTPIIVCSIESEQQKAFLMGAIEYFVKPIKYNYLVEVLTSYRLKKDSNILIVDADVPTLNLMKGAVTQLGFNAIAESYPTKVMDLVEDIHLDLAIVDLEMPEMNGYELIKVIKSNNKFANLPIIIYTGKENYQDDLEKIDGLFEELLQKKSTNIEDLADTINAMINRYDEPASPEELLTKIDVVKILLVEDYKHSQIIVTRLLKKNNFENIAVVENGVEALDEVKKQKYDLILMDMQLPVMNGFEAIEKIRLLPEYKDTPIIALTAFAMKGDREKCLEAGATDYIPKPIDGAELIKMIKFYLYIEDEEYIYVKQ